MIELKKLLVIFLGVWIRYSLRFSAYYKQFSRRVEISTPVTGWNRVIEGIHLKESQISPYSGDTFHESPLFLYLYSLLFKTLTEQQIGLFFIFIDILTAFVLGEIVQKQLKFMKSSERTTIEQACKKEKKLDKKFLFDILPLNADECSSKFMTECIYILSPYSILACVGQSTAVITNCLFGLTLLCATEHHRILSCFLLSLLTINSLYPVILLPAIILILEHCDSGIDFKSNKVRFSMLTSFAVFVGFVALDYSLCVFVLEPNESYIGSVYGFMLRVEELAPNIGLFWYFFTEIFDHFNDFFIWIFQINFFLFIIPFTVRFHRNPFFLTLCILFIHSIFKPYPTFSDFVLYLALLPQWSHLLNKMKVILVVSVIFALITIFLPIQWYLWIDLGTANANFYFGMTMAYNVAQILLVTDLMFVFVKREFFFDNLLLYQLSEKAERPLRVGLER